MASSNEPVITAASFFIILEKFSLVSSSDNISDLRERGSSTHYYMS